MHIRRMYEYYIVNWNERVMQEVEYEERRKKK